MKSAESDETIHEGHDAPPPYTAVLVVEVDDESEWPPSHWLCGDEGVLKGGLSAGGNRGAELEGSEVLDVELVILKGSERKKRQSQSSSPAGGGGGSECFCTCGYRKEASRDSTMKFSDPLLVKPSRNLTMLLAGKSGWIHEDQTEKNTHKSNFFFLLPSILKL